MMIIIDIANNIEIALQWTFLFIVTGYFIYYIKKLFYAKSIQRNDLFEFFDEWWETISNWIKWLYVHITAYVSKELAASFETQFPFLFKEKEEEEEEEEEEEKEKEKFPEKRKLISHSFGTREDNIPKGSIIYEGSSNDTQDDSAFSNNEIIVKEKKHPNLCDVNSIIETFPIKNLEAEEKTLPDECKIRCIDDDDNENKNKKQGEKKKKKQKQKEKKQEEEKEEEEEEKGNGTEFTDVIEGEDDRITDSETDENLVGSDQENNKYIDIPAKKKVNKGWKKHLNN